MINEAGLVKDALAGLGVAYAVSSFAGNALVQWGGPKYQKLGVMLQKFSAEIAEVKDELDNVRKTLPDP